jgi:putative DNA-invertase from lambdoid prophage Rac
MNSQLAAKRVVGYVRGSTDEQLNTLEAQENQIRRYCEYKNLELIEVFTDSGVSGTTPFFERPAACEMMMRMNDLGATAIVITKLDRGFRDQPDCAFTVDNLTKRGIGLHLLDLPIPDLNSPEGKMILGVFALLAQFENERRSQRQKDAFALIKSKGQRCGTIPYGWQIRQNEHNGQNHSDNFVNSVEKNLVPDEEEQRVLRQIVHWIEVDGFGVSKIARLLNDAGAPTKQGGKKWFPATVASVYKHRRLSPGDSLNRESLQRKAA